MEIRTLRLQIEKRSLERIGHVLRINSEGTTKAAVLGWLETLENLLKTPGKKRKKRKTKKKPASNAEGCFRQQTWPGIFEAVGTLEEEGQTG